MSISRDHATRLPSYPTTMPFGATGLKGRTLSDSAGVLSTCTVPPPVICHCHTLLLFTTRVAIMKRRLVLIKEQAEVVDRKNK